MTAYDVQYIPTSQTVGASIVQRNLQGGIFDPQGITIII